MKSTPIYDKFILNYKVTSLQTIDSTKVVLKELPGKAFIVNFKNLNTFVAKVRILDSAGNRLLSEVVYEPEYFSAFYNIAPLRPGKYYMEIEDDHRIWITPIILLKNQVLIEIEEQQEILKPIYQSENCGLKVTYFPSNQIIQCLELIEEKTGYSFCEADLPNTIDREKQINFSGLPLGNYTLVLHSGKHIFEKEFRLSQSGKEPEIIV